MQEGAVFTTLKEQCRPFTRRVDCKLLTGKAITTSKGNPDEEVAYQAVLQKAKTADLLVACNQISKLAMVTQSPHF